MKTHSQPATKQDIWVCDRLRQKRQGYFVEIGAHNGVHHSNTLMLQEDFGWIGVLVEPNPKFHAELAANRPGVKIDHTVIGPREEEVQFVLGDSFGGIWATMPEDWKQEHLIRENPVVMRKTKTLRRLLDENCTPATIDYLSLDVEGAELDILSSFFAQPTTYRFNVITVEFRYDQMFLEGLEDLLERNGYVLEHVEAFDAFFTHKDLA